MRIAVIGSGVSGLVAGMLLSKAHDVVVYEAGERPGGHAHTVTVEGVAIDTGFVVFNERNYPGFVKLLADLQVASQPSDMSFGVHCEGGVQYRGSANPWWLFAQRRNLLRPSFYRFVRAIGRFNQAAREDHDTGEGVTLGAYVRELDLPHSVMDHYLIPMAAAVWSADPASVANIPARFFIDFFRNHGFFDLRGRPSWRTIVDGSRVYVDAIADRLGSRLRLSEPVRHVERFRDRVEVTTTKGSKTFDQVVFALRGDHALRLLKSPTVAEREVLGAVQYQANDVVLHSDTSVMPPNRRAWASWNYFVPKDRDERATVTYHCNRLQKIRTRTQYFISLNRTDDIAPELIRHQFNYAHPVFSNASRAAQLRRDEVNGVSRSWYCGAYWGNGFHEDGVESARVVTRAFGVDL